MQKFSRVPVPATIRLLDVFWILGASKASDVDVHLEISHHVDLLLHVVPCTRVDRLGDAVDAAILALFEKLLVPCSHYCHYYYYYLI